MTGACPDKPCHYNKTELKTIQIKIIFFNHFFDLCRQKRSPKMLFTEIKFIVPFFSIYILSYLFVSIKFKKKIVEQKTIRWNKITQYI